MARILLLGTWSLELDEVANLLVASRHEVEMNAHCGDIPTRMRSDAVDLVLIARDTPDGNHLISLVTQLGLPTEKVIIYDSVRSRRPIVHEAIRLVREGYAGYTQYDRDCAGLFLAHIALVLTCRQTAA